MNSIVSKSALIFSTFGLGLTALTFNPQTVQAAIINYDFDIGIDFGPLLGNTYNGTLSYDNSLIPAAPDLGGYKSIPISNFAFNFEGNDYTEADDTFASVDFVTANNDFLGLNYAGPNFTFASGFFLLDLNDASFTYDLGSTGSGSGTIAYTETPIPTSTPEPRTLLGLLTLVGGMLLKSYKNSVHK